MVIMLVFFYFCVARQIFSSISSIPLDTVFLEKTLLGGAEVVLKEQQVL